MEQVASNGRVGGERAMLFPTVLVFVCLQALDLISTLVGLRLGASEGSPFVCMLMHAGPATGVVMSKLLALALGGVCIHFQKHHVLRWAVYWYAALVIWNLLVIFAMLRTIHGN